MEASTREPRRHGESMERARENRRPHVITLSKEKSCGRSKIKGHSRIEKLAPVSNEGFIFTIPGRVIEVNVNLNNRSKSLFKHLVGGREDSGEAAPD